MPAFRPLSRAELIRGLRSAGFDGPYAGANHAVMVRGRKKVPIPNAHQGDIGLPLLGRILKQAGIAREEWERL